MMTPALLALCVSVFAVAQPPATPPPPPQPAREAKAPERRAMIEQAVLYLRSKQDPSGGWNVNPGGPTFPAITGLVLQGLLGEEDVSENDPVVAGAVAFILSRQQEDGGIYDRILPSYNTAICLAALSQLRTKSPEVQAAIRRAQDFLIGLQYGEGAIVHEGNPESAQRVDPKHPFYGGWGYGNRGRPDLSNSAFVIEALRTSGLSESDPVFQRALVFLQRCQMAEKDAGGGTINDMEYARGSRQGGFIYSTSENKDKVGSGQSFAGETEETLDDGTKVSRLRAYGSMTYSGFKSYLYAGLSRADPRVTLAREWIARNYTVEENPGLGTDGMYYYYLVFAKANAAFGDETIRVKNADGSESERRWKDDLVRRLGTLQNPDGSFRSVDDRWMENDPVLITAYSLIALRQAR
ncbi:MAG TPA: prenyltransferase/squalene oxidase repeat-containing protein [Dehalococcoidia bacterium]|nr:prenyltransferase/squalene oxidase repeat-containing protein [Dehalococcoidia bacterium]